MIYAYRESEHSRRLVEFRSQKELDDTNAANEAKDGGAPPPFVYRRISREEAHQWVRRGNIHETGLYIDRGRIRYAKDDPTGY